MTQALTSCPNPEPEPRRRISMTLGPETKVTIGSVSAIVLAVGSATLYLSNLLHTVQSSIDALKTEQKQAWTVPDMERWSNKLQWVNPTMSIPDPRDTVRDRLRMDASRGDPTGLAPVPAQTMPAQPFAPSQWLPETPAGASTQQ